MYIIYILIYTKSRKSKCKSSKMHRVPLCPDFLRLEVGSLGWNSDCLARWRRRGSRGRVVAWAALALSVFDQKMG